MTSTSTHTDADAPRQRPAGGAEAWSRLLFALGIAAAMLAAGLAPTEALLFGLLAFVAVTLLPTSVQAAPKQGTFAPELQRGEAVRLLALELSVDRLRSVIDSLREGVVVVDAGGEIVLANPEARQVLRDPATLPVGRPLADALAHELVPAVQRALALLDDEQLGRDRPARLQALPFGKRVIDLTGVRVRSRDSGQDFGTVLLFVDATRSHELAHLKDRFLSGISHELRTPLTNICAYAEILRHLTPGETSEWPEFVRIVHEESLLLNRLVDTVFDYAQLESGEAVFQIVECEPRDVIVSACERARERASTRGIELSFECAPTLPKVAVDVARFAHVLDHLLDNAVKFTPRDGRVRLRASVDGQGLCVRVDDSGKGIPAADRAVVFEKFQQLGDPLVDKVEGAGLGLATTKAIVTRLGGSIRCETSEWRGAAFVVWLPAAAHSRAVGRSPP